MAQITTLLIPAYTIPKTKSSQQARSIVVDFQPTDLANNVTIGDNIACITLPKNAHIVAAGVRINGAISLAGGYIQLQSEENSVVSVLTEPLGATYAGSIAMTSAPPLCSVTYVKTIEILVGGASVDKTATGKIEVSVHYDFYKLAG